MSSRSIGSSAQRLIVEIFGFRSNAVLASPNIPALYRTIMPNRKTKGQIESEISDSIVKFEKDYMGRGPEDVRTHLIGDLLLVRLRGVLTPAEKHLAKDSAGTRSSDLIKQVRIELLERGRPLLEEIVNSITGRRVISLHTDISIRTGERIIVFTLDGSPGVEDTA